MNLGHLNDPFDICHLSFGISLYTLPQYSISINKQIKQCQISNVKFQKIRPYIKLLSYFPAIQMVGITGSASMGNCKKNDDIDLLIITKSKSLWMARFFCVVLAKLMRLYGKHVCLNLFFDESDLIVPKQKQTHYIGHELLQMKPVINKNNTYERMILDNKWICTLFPNSKKRRNYPVTTFQKKKSQTTFLTSTISYILSYCEVAFKSIQLPIIQKNKTGLIITPTQLWLFKKDFEKKLRKM